MLNFKVTQNHILISNLHSETKMTVQHCEESLQAGINTTAHHSFANTKDFKDLRIIH